jgi:DegV family protein with EDD domain
MIIVTDSACDIRGEEVEKYNIRVIPLNVTFGDKTYKDGIDLKIDEFYEELLKGNTFPKTGSPSPQDYVDIFEEAKEKGEEVLCITISTGLSGTYQNALLAKDIAEYDKVYVVDSLSCLQGLRLEVINACRLRDEGKSVEEIVEVLEDIKHRIHIFSIVDTMEYFYKGGRISKGAYAIGSLLKIKPFITLDKDGKIVKNGQAMGYMKAYLIAEQQPKKFPIDKEYGLFYGYTMGEKNIEKFIDKTFHKFDMDKYDVSRIGCAAGSHIGPGAVCFVYVSTKERV